MSDYSELNRKAQAAIDAIGTLSRARRERKFNDVCTPQVVQALIAENEALAGVLRRFVNGEHEQEENQAERHMYFTEAQSLLALVNGELEGHTIVPDSAIKAIHVERDQLKVERAKLIRENKMLRDCRPVHIKAFYKFPEKLLKIRLASGLTQRQLADLTGLSCPLISNYETGVTRPRMKNVLRLEAALDCSGAFQGEDHD
jgi:DNA-binding transcriptional regulator YiaG